jgi:hypothetical protein
VRIWVSGTLPPYGGGRTPRWRVADLSESPSTAASWPHHGLRIDVAVAITVLVAEDDEGPRSVLERGLRVSGDAVDATGDG